MSRKSRANTSALSKPSLRGSGSDRSNLRDVIASPSASNDTYCGCAKLSPIDKRILNRLQEDIPFAERPWEIVADDLKIKEGFLLKRIAFLKKQGIIRRISAVFAPRKISFVSTLVAARIAPAYIGKVVKKINSYPEVTHNYGRIGEYNLWFTLVARNSKRIARIIAQLKKDKNIERLSEFPATRIFKINVKFAA